MHTKTQLSFARPPPVAEVVPTESKAMEGGEPAPYAHFPASNDTCTPTTSTISSRAWRKVELAKMECEYERRCQRLALMEKELQYAQVHPAPLFVAVLHSDLSTTNEKEEEPRARDKQDHGQLSPETTLHPATATITSMISTNTDALAANAATGCPHITDGPLIHHDRSLCGVAEAQAGEKTDSSSSFVGTPAVTFGPEVAATATADTYMAATADADTAFVDSPSIIIPHASTSPKANTTQAVAAGTAPSLDETGSCAILIER